MDIAVSQPAEVQLYAVDDAVLRLTGYQLPDPVSAFFPDHALAVTIGEPLPRLVRRQKFGEKGEVQPGGGGGMGPSGDIRSNFVTTVPWKTLETDASGKAHAEIELPDNLTTFRILAVATTGGDKAGAAQAEVRVSLPLLVLPALPRFARVGDEFEAGVAVHSVKTFDVKVSVDVDGLQYKVFYLENGSGQPLVCQHTAGCHNHQWRGLLEDEAVRRAYQGTLRPQAIGGGKVCLVSEFSDQLLMFLLKCRNPKVFGDRRRFDRRGAGDDSHPAPRRDGSSRGGGRHDRDEDRRARPAAGCAQGRRRARAFTRFDGARRPARGHGPARRISVRLRRAALVAAGAVRRHARGRARLRAAAPR